MSHRLLLSNENALYEYRLLHTMAFNSSLLVRLWGKILKERQITAYAKNAQPLLSVLARGIRLTAAESASIVPMLVVFAALFGYLLVTIHDTGELPACLVNGGRVSHEVTVQPVTMYCNIRLYGKELRVQKLMHYM